MYASHFSRLFSSSFAFYKRTHSSRSCRMSQCRNPNSRFSSAYSNAVGELVWRLKGAGASRQVADSSSCTRMAAYAQPFCHNLCTFLPCANRPPPRLRNFLRVSSSVETTIGNFPAPKKCLATPGGQRSTTRVAQYPHRRGNAVIVHEVANNSRLLLLLLRTPGKPTQQGRIQKRRFYSRRQLFESILNWIAQLTDSHSHTLAQLNEEFNFSKFIFVQIHELPPGNPRFRPHCQTHHPLSTWNQNPPYMEYIHIKAEPNRQVEGIFLHPKHPIEIELPRTFSLHLKYVLPSIAAGLRQHPH